VTSAQQQQQLSKFIDWLFMANQWRQQSQSGPRCSGWLQQRVISAAASAAASRRAPRACCCTNNRV